MTLLLANARLIDPEAGTETRGDLLIEGGRVKAVGHGLGPALRTIDCGGRALAPGIVDMC
ncbi:MAG: dihydroorotase, partial [Paracoccaceae bacterium]